MLPPINFALSKKKTIFALLQNLKQLEGFDYAMQIL